MALDVVETIGPQSGLYTDLAMDSLQAFELIILVEGLAGVDVPSIALPELYTVEDAYNYYLELRRNTSQEPT